MSARLIDVVIDEAALDLEPSEVARIRDLVCAGKLAPACGWEGREFMQQIVANATNGVDVDKVCGRECFCVSAAVCVCVCDFMQQIGQCKCSVYVDKVFFSAAHNFAMTF